MTYDQWFRSQQGIAYEGLYLFAEAAWEHQQKRIDELETQLAKNNPLLDEAADAIDKLTAERDELLKAAEAIEINAEECLDFDECTAMLVQIDDYHKLMEAIASVKEKRNAAD